MVKRGIIMNKRKGMTLVEVVVAIAIFAIVVAMVFPILTRMGLINVQSRHMLNAQEIGVLVAEDLLYEAGSFQSSRTNAETRSDFILRLQDDPMLLHSLKETDQVFHLASDDENTVLILEYDDYELRLEFHDNNSVRIIVVFREETFETLIWMRFN